MFLIKVQYFAYKNPRWVLGSDECPGFAKAIQKSRKTATRFNTREEAEAVVKTLTAGVTVPRWNIEVVASF